MEYGAESLYKSTMEYALATEQRIRWPLLELTKSALGRHVFARIGFESIYFFLTQIVQKNISNTKRLIGYISKLFEIIASQNNTSRMSRY